MKIKEETIHPHIGACTYRCAKQNPVNPHKSIRINNAEVYFFKCLESVK